MEYWGQKDTTITFCEVPYKDSIYIAEYYNSISGLFYSFIGLYFLNTKLKNISYTLIILGLGTFALHATQRWYGQWLDELSMLLLSFQSIKHLRNINHKKTYNSIFLFMTILYGLWHTKTFIIMFISSQIYIFDLLRKVKPKKNFKLTSYVYRLFYKYIFIISIISWILDQYFCKYFKSVHLHAIWHIGTAIVAFLGFNNLLICK